MTEYDYSPEAYDRYVAQQERIGRWVDNTTSHAHEFRSPFELNRSDSGKDQEFYSSPPGSPPGPREQSGLFSPTSGPAISYAAFGAQAGPIQQHPVGTYFSPAAPHLPATYMPPPPQEQHRARRSRSHEGHSRHHDSSHRHHGSSSRSHHARSPTYIIQPVPMATTYPSFASQGMLSPPITLANGQMMYYPSSGTTSQPTSQPQSRVQSPIQPSQVYTYQGQSYAIQSPPGSVYGMQSPPASIYSAQSPGSYQQYPMYTPQQMQQLPATPQYFVIPTSTSKPSKRSKSKTKHKSGTQNIYYV